MIRSADVKDAGHGEVLDDKDVRVSVVVLAQPWTHHGARSPVPRLHGRLRVVSVCFDGWNAGRGN